MVCAAIGYISLHSKHRQWGESKGWLPIWRTCDAPARTDSNKYSRITDEPQAVEGGRGLVSSLMSHFVMHDTEHRSVS